MLVRQLALKLSGQVDHQHDSKPPVMKGLRLAPELTALADLLSDQQVLPRTAAAAEQS